MTAHFAVRTGIFDAGSMLFSTPKCGDTQDQKQRKWMWIMTLNTNDKYAAQHVARDRLLMLYGPGCQGVKRIAAC